MKSKLLILTAVSAIAIGSAGCSFSVGTGDGTNAAANTNSAANKSNTAPANTNSAKKAEGSKPALKNEKKPEGTAKTAKKNPVPADWIYVYDEAKGYGFALPDGSEGESETVEGIDVFAATTPAPSEIDIFGV